MGLLSFSAGALASIGTAKSSKTPSVSPSARYTTRLESGLIRKASTSPPVTRAASSFTGGALPSVGVR